MSRLVSAFVIVGFFVWPNLSLAEMTSTNFKIKWDSVTAGGSDTSTSASYGLHDSVGEIADGEMSGTNYKVQGGYRAGVYDRIISFDLFIQNGTTTYSVTSLSGTTINTTNTSSVSVGGYLLLVEDLGSTNIQATGKVTNIVPNASITIDAWSNNGTMPTIDGTNDYYFSMGASSVDFGSLSDNSIVSRSVGIDVSSDDPNGYVVQVAANGTLTKGDVSIANVSDGSVTTGSSEYGATSSDSSLLGSTFDTADTAITTSFQDIVTESSTKFDDRHFLTLKLSKDTNTASGTYTQVISIIASGNF